MSYSDIKNYCKKNEVTLVAVSKTKSQAQILEVYEQGQRIFGENKARELEEKYKMLPKDIEWHMIGHLQSNKVKYIAPFVAMIHSVDSQKLLGEINKQAIKNNRQIPVLLQFHIATEQSKFGLSWSEAEALLEQKEKHSNIDFCGVMGMATFTENELQVKKEFSTLRNYFDRIKNEYFPNKEDFKTISMGMSGDYKLAVEQGSNMIRVGSLIFGSRNY